MAATSENQDGREVLAADLKRGDIIRLNGRLVRVVEDPIGKPTWKVLVEDVVPRRVDLHWHLGMKVLRVSKGER